MVENLSMVPESVAVCLLVTAATNNMEVLRQHSMHVSAHQQKKLRQVISHFSPHLAAESGTYMDKNVCVRVCVSAHATELSG